MTTNSFLSQEAWVGNFKVKNRIVMPSMGTGMASIDGEVTLPLVQYYEERARGGAGMIIVELACVDSPVGRASLTQLRIDHPKYIAGLNEITEAIHIHSCKCMLQLIHAGRQTTPAIAGGRSPVAPSPVACRMMKAMPEELNLQGINNIKSKFVKAASFAYKAGFDGVELHAAHGYLLSQFLSPYTNHRNDEYGGNLTKRLRLIVEIIKEIKKRLPGLAVGVRFNAVDYVPGGIELEEGCEIAKALETAGADLLNVSSGIYESGQTTIEPSSFAEGWRAFMAEAVKKEVKVPVISAGVIRHPSVAEDIIASGKADFVAVGRGMLADPCWANKALSGEADRIRPCISCNSCIDRSFKGLHIRCAVNPRATTEWRLKKLEKESDLRILIIGSGPAGMQAALSASEAGCHVDLFEKENEIGGLLPFAAKPPHKDKIAWLLDYFKGEISRSGIAVHLGQEFTIQQMQGFAPDAIIIACGAQPVIPDIEGIDNKMIIDMKDVLDDSCNIKDKRVLVLGGGTNGCELAECLLNNNNTVTIVEKQGQLAVGLENMTRLDLLMRLKKKGIVKKTDTIVERIENGKVILNNLKNKTMEDIEVDHIVFACGYESRNSLYDVMNKNFKKVYLVGDAYKARNIQEAIKEGDMAVRDIISNY